MKNELKELVVAYVKADSEVESQKSRLADLNRAKYVIADELSSLVHEAIGTNEDIYLDYGNGILLCSDCHGDMEFTQIHPITADDLKPLKAE